MTPRHCPAATRYVARLTMAILIVLCASMAGAAQQEPTELQIEPGVSLRATLRDQIADVDVVGCPDLSRSITLGRGNFTVQVRLKETLVALDPTKDERARDTLCHYRAIETGSVQIRTAGLVEDEGIDPFQLAPTIAGVDVSAYRREDARLDDPSAFSEVALSWTNSSTDQIPLDLERFGISFRLYSFGATFTTSDAGDLILTDGYIAIQLGVDGAVQLQGPVYLAGDVSSTIVYSWTENASSWTDGQWDLGGMAGVRLEVRRDEMVPVAVLALTFDPNGIVRGTMSLSEITEWEVNGFELQLRNSSLQAEVDIRNDSWRIVSGSIAGGVRARRPITGDFNFLLAWQNNHFEMQIASNSEISAFGVTCQELALRVDLNAETLEFHEIGGSLAFKHNEFDAAVRIASFLVRDGALVTFLGSGQVGYRRFLLNISEINYTASNGASELALRASLDVGWSTTGTGTIDIENFKIDERGNISSFSIRSAVSAPPVDVRFAATFDRAGSIFTGRFQGDFAGATEFSGTVVIGAVAPPDDFSYGYLSIQFQIERGVPIGNSGLVLVGLSGAFGCNYLPPGAPGGSRTDGLPQRDTYYLAGGLTVGDVGGLASLTGELAIVLGATQAVGIKGTVQVTRRTPYFTGAVSAKYVLGSGQVYGDLRASVRIPTSGSVVHIKDNTLIYRVGQNQWGLSGEGLGGTFFTFLEIDGARLVLDGDLTNPINSMTGDLGARLRGGTRATWVYPASFAPWGDGSGQSCSPVNTGRLVLDCDCTTNTDDAFGFGFGGGFSVGLSGSLSSRLGPSGTSGTFDLEANLSGSVGLTTPASGWFGIPCASLRSVSAYGRLRGSNQNGLLSVDGALRIATSDGYSFDVPFTYTF